MSACIHAFFRIVWSYLSLQNYSEKLKGQEIIGPKKIIDAPLMSFLYFLFVAGEAKEKRRAWNTFVLGQNSFFENFL